MAGPHRRDCLLAAFESLNRRDVARFLSVFDADVVTVDPSLNDREGRAGVLGIHWLLVVAFPDVRYNVDDILEVGSRTVAQVTAIGTHTGALSIHPPTGARTIIPLCAVAIWRRSAIVSWQVYWDLASTLRQISPPSGDVRSTVTSAPGSHGASGTADIVLTVLPAGEGESTPANVATRRDRPRDQV